MIGCRYASVPVVRATGGLRDSISDCSLGEGNGFVFESYAPDGLQDAILRAIDRYADHENWKKLQIHDMREDFSWNVSAKKYRDLYESIALEAPAETNETNVPEEEA